MAYKRVSVTSAKPLPWESPRAYGSPLGEAIFILAVIAKHSILVRAKLKNSAIKRIPGIRSRGYQCQTLEHLVETAAVREAKNSSVSEARYQRGLSEKN